MAVLFFSMGSEPCVAQAVNGAAGDARVAAVNRILADYRDDQTRLEPEAASLAGDKRYDDQLSDFSASAANARVSRGQTYIQRLSEAGTAGLPEKTRQAADGLLNSLIDEQSGDRGRSWQRPLEQFTRLHTQLLSIAARLPFQDAKDYDDYATRLKKVPLALSQIMTNLELGAEGGRTVPPEGVAKAMAEVQEVVGQPAEASVFLAPLRRFPANVPAEERKRLTASVTEAISTEVIPGYQRFGRFVAAHSTAKSAAPAM